MARGERIPFLDVLRGVAIVLMVLNHTARWWLDEAVQPGRSPLVYATVILPGATFLFLVGFCLPLADQQAGPQTRRSRRVARFVVRGLAIIVAGLALNAVVFREHPPWSGRVLQTIGLGVIVLGPLVPLLGLRAARPVLVTIAACLYVTFAAAAGALSGWLGEHPLVAQVLFREFPPWPWLAVPLVGLVLGGTWLDRRRAGRDAERRFFVAAGVVGGACLLAYLALDAWLDPRPRLGFERDLLVNDHWTPRGTTLLVVVGGIASLLALVRWASDVGRAVLGPLAVMGRTALMLYLFHHVVVVTVVSRALGWRAGDWVAYAGANLVLFAVLVLVAHAWLAVRRLGRRPADALRGRVVALRRAA
jgi:uncharacterized membrane protein